MKFVLLTIILLSLLTACGSEGKKFSSKYAGIWMERGNIEQAKRVALQEDASNCERFRTASAASDFRISAMRIMKSGAVSAIFGEKDGIQDPRTAFLIGRIDKSYILKLENNVELSYDIPQQFGLKADFYDEKSMRITSADEALGKELASTLPLLKKINEAQFVFYNDRIQKICQ
jgi:hypothetical protein